MSVWSRVLPHRVDLVVAILLVLALVGFAASIVVIYALDEYVVPSVNERSVPAPRLY
jgi:uncharacterized membrane protein (UPF0182 family)